MNTTLSSDATAKIKRALAVRLIVSPLLSIGLTVAGVLVANAIEKKLDQSSN